MFIPCFLRFILIASAGFTFEYHGGNLIESVEISIVMWGDPSKYKFHDYVMNGDLTQYFQVLTSGGYLDWLSEYNVNGQTIRRGSYKSTYIADVPIDVNNIHFDSNLFVQYVESAKFNTNSNTVLMVYFPMGVFSNTLFTHQGILCLRTANHCIGYATITDPSAGITMIPGARSMFFAGVGLGTFVLFLLLSWPLWACSESGKCWRNGIKCGINVTGRSVMHLSFLLAVIAFGICGALICVMGNVEYQISMFYTGLALAIVAGGLIIIWFVIYLVSISLQKTTNAKDWCFSFTLHNVIFNTIYAISIILLGVTSGILVWQSMRSAVYLSSSHELIELIVSPWSNIQIPEYNNIWTGLCNVCLMEWYQISDKYYAQKCWSNLHQRCVP